MYSKIKQFLDAVPRALTSANEIYNFARNKYKQIMGVFPDGLDDVFLRRGSAEMQDARKKVIKFPEGGKDKTDPFTPRPDPRVKQPPGAKMDVIRANENIAGGSGYAKGDTKYNADVLADEIALMRGANREDLPVDDQIKLYGEAYDYLAQFNRLNNPSAKGEFGITVLDDAGKPLETKATTPEGIMDFLMGKGKSKDVNIGKAPKTTKKKPAVDSELQKAEDNKQMFMDFENRIETEAEMLERMNRQNKEAVERIKKRKEKDFDPEDKADGGRIGFSGGGAGYAGDQTEQAQPQGPGPMGPVFETGDIGAAAKEVMTRMSGIAGSPGLINIPISGGLGFDVGFGAGRSMDAGISFNPNNPNFNFKGGISTLGGKPSLGFQFSKRFKDGGRIGFKDGSNPKDPSRRGFMKLMAGLASIPILGKFFKPASKVAKTVATASETVPPYFFKLVNRIKQFGEDITSGNATQERQRVTRYEIDGDDYVMTEDLSTGKIDIEKEKIVGVRYLDESGAEDITDGVASKEYLTYKPKQVDVDPKTGKKIEYPEEYEEITARPEGYDGTDFETVAGLNDDTAKQIVKETGDLESVKKNYPDVELSSKEKIEKEVREFIKQRNQKAGGGLAYMLGE